MKLKFYCGIDDWTGKREFELSGECSGQVTLEIDRDIFDAEGASVVCPLCKSILNSQYHAEIPDR